MKIKYTLLTILVIALILIGYFYGGIGSSNAKELQSKVPKPRREMHRNVGSVETLRRATELVEKSRPRISENLESERLLEVLRSDTVAEQTDFDQAHREFKVELKKVQSAKVELDQMILRGEDQVVIFNENEKFERLVGAAVSKQARMNQSYKNLQSAQNRSVSKIIANSN